MSFTFKDYISLFEARKDDIEYVEVRVKDKLSRIVVDLEGNKSGPVTKLAKRYMILDRAVKTLSDRRNEANEFLTDKVADYFDEAADALYTRVINTVSFTLTLNKQEFPEDKKKVNFEKICEELEKLIAEELIEKADEIKAKIEEIKSKHTEIIPKEKQDIKKPGLRVKVNEGILELPTKLKAILTSFLSKIKSWAKSFDKKLASIEAMT